MIKGLLSGVAALAIAACAFGGYEWDGISPETRLGGRMVSAGYLRGKVVLLDCRDYADPAAEPALKRLQTLWTTYKTKPFIVLGSHRGKAGREKVRAVMDRLGITYPVYAGAKLKGCEFAEKEDGGANMMYVVDSTCSRRLYAGVDDRAVAGVAGNAIFAARMPSNARQWKFLLDYEIENLPGQAYLRLKDLFSSANSAVLAEMRSKYPDDAQRYRKAYGKMGDDGDVRKLSKLVELARLVKDRDTDSAAAKRIRPEHLDRVEDKYEDLKKSANPYIVQEAKNALGDIMFAKAALKNRK